MKRQSRPRAAVEDQVVGQPRSVLVDLRVRRDVRGVDDGHVEAGLDAVVQEHGVEHGARVLRSPNDTLETPSVVSTPGSSP
jgi:hypothetical protein